jgi:hypothetical protein
LPACRPKARARFLIPETAATIGAMKGCAAVGAIAAVHPIGAVVIAAANMRSLYRGRFVRLASLCRFAYLADAVVNPLRRHSRCRQRLTCCFGPNMSGRARGSDSATFNTQESCARSVVGGRTISAPAPIVRPEW